MSSPKYKIYRVETHLGLQDPLMGPGTRYHNTLFINTSPSGSGRTIQVIGTISDLNGMTFQEEASPAPESSDAFHQKYYLGQIRSEDYEQVVTLLRAIDPPPRQRVFDTKTLRYVKCKPDGTTYTEGEEEREYWKCTEWTLQRAVPALFGSGLLDTTSIS
ncbi:hypothetical protein K505DRAFT_321745 [Melanomma pulvis-pyrius CBS 109.77]|uniref:Uncharacterized protein n=1 Tax=Melanomma pulvis-pyrius CBS 109.77 TaxID=1314802 RepID=A0A6A6XQH3_9PLEO|nr:hypothetical protein K505DRAFT_321745 [Melanomma pulvis-pyrius CBS 109.77]